MIGGRALGLQQGPHGDIVNAVRAPAGDEGDSDDHEAYGRETDQQHGRAHDRGGSERSQADPAADDPFGQRRADQHPGGPQSGQQAERGRAAFQRHDDKEHKGDIGNGGREHALAWKLAQSPRVTEVLVAPGNAGTATEARCRNVPVKVTDIEGLLALARDEGVSLTVVGPEVPLVAGVVDRFRAAGLRIFGPSRDAAQKIAAALRAGQSPADVGRANNITPAAFNETPRSAIGDAATALTAGHLPAPLILSTTWTLSSQQAAVGCAGE